MIKFCGIRIQNGEIFLTVDAKILKLNSITSGFSISLFWFFYILYFYSNTYECVNSLYSSRETDLSALVSGIFPVKPIQRIGVKILSSKQIPQRLQIVLSEVDAETHLKT